MLSRAMLRLPYHTNRFGFGRLNPIRAPWRRHMLPLPMTVAVGHALLGLAGVVHAAGVPLHAKLVELSVIVVLCGAGAQDLHTDISPGTPDVHLEAPSLPLHPGKMSSAPTVAPLVSAWLALQPVTSGMGPTVVHPGSHRRLVKRCIRLEATALAERELRGRMLCRYDADGTFHPLDDLHDVSAGFVGAEGAHAEEEVRMSEDVSRELEEFGTVPDPQELLLDVGDIGLMDCRLSHFGSSRAWSSGRPRVVLNATFDSTCSGAMRGFTYHGSNDLPPTSLGGLFTGPRQAFLGAADNNLSRAWC